MDKRNGLEKKETKGSLSRFWKRNKSAWSELTLFQFSNGFEWRKRKSGRWNRERRVQNRQRVALTKCRPHRGWTFIFTRTPAFPALKITRLTGSEVGRRWRRTNGRAEKRRDRKRMDQRGYIENVRIRQNEWKKKIILSSQGMIANHRFTNNKATEGGKDTLECYPRTNKGWKISRQFESDVANSGGV